MIELSKVSKRYESGKTHQDVFRDLTFKFEETGIYSVVGPSGSGKTTLLNLISGLDKFNKGSLKIFGKEISSLNQEQLSRLRRNFFGFAYQYHHLLENLNIFDNAHAVIVLTEWEDYKNIEWDLVAKNMVKPSWVFDSRSIVNIELVKKAGFHLWRLGDGTQKD